MRNLYALTCTLVLLATPAGAAPTAIEHVTIIDPATGKRQPDMTVVLDEAKILRVTKGREGKLPPETRHVNGAGKYLIPGLWDMHVHLFNNASRPGTNDSSVYFPLLLAHGVTGVRDMWTDREDRKLIVRWRREIEGGLRNGPRVVAGSRILDGTPVLWANSRPVTDAHSAIAAVRDEKAAGAQFIKVYDRLSRSAFFAVAREAKRQGLPLAGHVPMSVTAIEASTAGQRSIEHLTDMPESCSGREASIRSLAEGRERAVMSATAL